MNKKTKIFLTYIDVLYKNNGKNTPEECRGLSLKQLVYRQEGYVPQMRNRIFNSTRLGLISIHL